MVLNAGRGHFKCKLLQLGLDNVVCNRIGVYDGHFTGEISGKLIDAAGKASALDEYRIALGLRREQVIAIGDGANDLAMLGMAGMSVAYHAKPLVREQAACALNFVGLAGVLNLFELPWKINVQSSPERPS